MPHDKDENVLKQTDPVCGMSVDSHSSEHSRYEGETFYFCSQGCKDRFEAQPAEFAKSVVPK